MMTRLTIRHLAPALALLAVFPLVAAKAQQAAAPEKTAGDAAAPAAAKSAATPGYISVPGAPVMGFGGPARARAAGDPAGPAVPAAAQRPRIDPVTGAPLAAFGQLSSAATEVLPGQQATPAGDPSVHQGLQVHGHWVIDIRNPDGTLVQHREFENSIQATGQGILVGLLSGYLVPGDWMIALGPQSGNGACVATYQFCGLIHNAATYPAQGYCTDYYCTGSTLSYTYNFGAVGLGGPFSIVLSGTITANQTGTIGNVTTLLNTCANIGYSATANPSSIETSSPATCVTQTTPEPWYGPFTGTSLTTPISVTNGQQIQTTVTITFS
jgi:hypothetical protein